MSAEVGSKGKVEVCGGTRWLVLIAQVSQCHQKMNLDFWTLVFSLRNESVAK